jgi:hypothetical protein
MKSLYFILLFSATFLYSVAQKPAFDEISAKESMQKSAEAMVELFSKGEFKDYIKYIHPKIVQMLGGKEKMVVFLEKQIGGMKDDGFVFKTVSVGTPSKILSSQGELQSIIPQTIELENPDGILTTKSSLIGISKDSGKTWHFIDAGSKTLSELKKVFKTLSNDLVIPVKKEPTFKSN